MLDGLWWLPSLIVFGVAGAGTVALVTAVRSRGRRRSALALDSLADRERQAGIALVRADERLKAAADEVDFATAQFGESTAARVADAVAVSRRELREAFLLRQQLADEVPDSESQRRRWNARILELCASIDARLDEHVGELDRRRASDSTAPATLRELMESLTAAHARITAAESAAGELRASLAASALSAVDTALDRARRSAVEAEKTLDRASERMDAAESSSEFLDAARRSLRESTTMLDAAERWLTAVTAARAELDNAIAQLRLAVGEATALDGGSTDAGSAGLNDAIHRCILALETAGDRTSPPDPLARLDLLREARERLDLALATVRSQQQRLSHARAALHGALFSARNHLAVARELIEANRGRIGPDARTRLSEADRQLSLAEVADDPVDALDLARRVSRLAQDAEALARYDLGPGPAPARRMR